MLQAKPGRGGKQQQEQNSPEARLLAEICTYTIRTYLSEFQPSYFHLQDRLRTLIRLCWSFEAAERPSFASLATEFGQPGCRLLRRLSTSEPRLDQVDLAKGLQRPLPITGGH